MIRTFLPVTFLFSTVAIAASNPTPVWPKNLPTDFKSQTVEQAYCGKSAGFQSQALCEYLKKNSSSKSEGRVSVKVNGALLVLNDGKRTVEIKRTKNVMRFEVNKKIIDMAELRDPAQLIAALENTIPKVAVSAWWMNAAFAENTGSKSLDQMIAASSRVLNFTVDQGLCDEAKDLVVACIDNPEDSGARILYDLSIKKMNANEVKTSKDEALRMLVANGQDLIVFIARMEKILENISNSEARDRLKKCPSAFGVGNGNGAVDIDACLSVLSDRKKQTFEDVEFTEKYKAYLVLQETAATKLQNMAGKSAPAAAGVRETGTR